MTFEMANPPPSGYWTTDAPLTPEQLDEDNRVISQVVIPDGMHIRECEVYVNGRIWEYKHLAVDFGSIRRESP